MKNILMLLFICASSCFNANSQDLSEYNLFIKDNFKEYIKHFKITDLQNFTVENAGDLNLTENVETLKSNEWNDYLSYDSDFLFTMLKRIML